MITQVAWFRFRVCGYRTSPFPMMGPPRIGTRGLEHHAWFEWALEWNMGLVMDVETSMHMYTVE